MKAFARNGSEQPRVAGADGSIIVSLVQAPCPVDCNDDGVVTINELIMAINIALEQADASVCTNADGNGSNSVTVDEIVAGVSAALSDCP